MRRKFRPAVEVCEDRALLSVVVDYNPQGYAASTQGSTITWHTVAEFSADNAQELMNNYWNGGPAPFDAIMDTGDEGGANLLNPSPTVIQDPNNPYKFTINWGHKADVIGCMIVPNADYTSFSVEVGYRYWTPGDYNYNVLIMAADGSNKVVSGTAHITGPAPSSGGNNYVIPAGSLADTTTIDWNTVY